MAGGLVDQGRQRDGDLAGRHGRRPAARPPVQPEPLDAGDWDGDDDAGPRGLEDRCVSTARTYSRTRRARGPPEKLWITARGGPLPLWKDDRLEVVGLAPEPETLVQRDRRSVEVVHIQGERGVALERQGAARAHGSRAHALTARLRRDVDALDLGAAVAGAADVHLEQQLAADLVDVGPAAGREDLDPPPVTGGIAGQRVLPHLLGVHGGGQVQHALLVAWCR